MKLIPTKFRIDDGADIPKFIRRIAIDSWDESKGYYWVVEGNTGDYWYYGKNRIVSWYVNIPPAARFNSPEEALEAYKNWYEK